MLDNQNKKVGFIVTSVTLGHSAFGCLISYIMFVIILYHLYYNFVKREDKITVILCANIYLLISIYTTILISMNIRTILGDLYGKSSDSSWCMLSGYMALVNLCILYMAFINQAFYRLVRIVYPQYIWLQTLRLYMILSLIEFIIACGLICILMLWNSMIYLENDYYCFASFTNIPGILWVVFVVYLVPCCCLLMIYVRITTFIRQQSKNRTVVVRQRQDRDLLIFRRIFVMMSLLVVLGLPGMTVIVMAIIKGEAHPLIARITFIPVSISMAGLSIVLLFSIPQLKSIALKLWQSDRVAPAIDTLSHSIPMRTIIRKTHFSLGSK